MRSAVSRLAADVRCLIRITGPESSLATLHACTGINGSSQRPGAIDRTKTLSRAATGDQHHRVGLQIAGHLVGQHAAERHAAEDQRHVARRRDRFRHPRGVFAAAIRSSAAESTAARSVAETPPAAAPAADGRRQGRATESVEIGHVMSRTSVHSVPLNVVPNSGPLHAARRSGLIRYGFMTKSLPLRSIGAGRWERRSGRLRPPGHRRHVAGVDLSAEATGRKQRKPSVTPRPSVSSRRTRKAVRALSRARRGPLAPGYCRCRSRSLHGQRGFPVRRQHVAAIEVEKPAGGRRRRGLIGQDQRRREKSQRRRRRIRHVDADAQPERSRRLALHHQQRVELPQSQAAMVGQPAAEQRRPLLAAADIDEMRRFDLRQARSAGSPGRRRDAASAVSSFQAKRAA